MEVENKEKKKPKYLSNKFKWLIAACEIVIDRVSSIHSVITTHLWHESVNIIYR